jgi:hypothetical protein
VNAPMRRPAGNAPSAAEVEAHAARHPLTASTEDGPRGGLWLVSGELSHSGERCHLLVEVFVDHEDGGATFWMDQHFGPGMGGGLGRLEDFEASHRHVAGFRWLPLTRDGMPAGVVP